LDFSLCNKSVEVSFLTRYTDIAYPLDESGAHVTVTVLVMVGLSLTKLVIFNGFDGRLASTPGRLLGIRWGNGVGLPLTFTHIDGGNWSSCSTEESNAQNRSWH